MNLLISQVVYQWDATTLEPALRSLSESLDVAARAGELDSATLWLSYNGPEPLDGPAANRLLQSAFKWPAHLLPRQPNLGYGGTNNLVLRQQMSEVALNEVGQHVVLVINPDVKPEPEAITNALRRLKEDPECGLVCPRILDWTGTTEAPGHKRYPSLAVLAARLFSPLLKLPVFRALNERYEYRDWPVERPSDDVVLVSGCFMMAGERYWQDLNGFDDGFFMYFEDFDLAARGREKGWRHRYDPAVRIRHAGGGAGQKGWRHRLWFIRSALRFFARHGWRWWRV